MSATTEKIPVTFAGVDRPGTVPAWAREFHPTRSTLSQLCAASVLPGISVVQSSKPKNITDALDKFSKLFSCVSNAADPSVRLVLGFNNAESKDVLGLAPIIARFPGLFARIELARGKRELEHALLEAMTKALAGSQEHDPLAEVSSIAKVDRSLRGPSGRIDAKKVADAFGFTPAELGRQIGVTRQRLSKTPDAEALQPLLRPYERIARLRTIFSDADFKAWLNTPNEHLEDGDPPIAYLKEGAQEPLAAFTENMLTGAPS